MEAFFCDYLPSDSNWAMANLQNPAVLGNDWALFKSETKYGMCVPQTELGNLKVMKTGCVLFTPRKIYYLSRNLKKITNYSLHCYCKYKGV